MSPETWPTLFPTTSCHRESLGALLQETDSQASLELRLNPLFPATRNLKASQQREDLASLYQENLVFRGVAGEVWWDSPRRRHIRCRLRKSRACSYQLPVTRLCSLVQLAKDQNKKRKSFPEVKNFGCLGLHVPNTSVMAWTHLKPTVSSQSSLPLRLLVPSPNITSNQQG